MLTPLSYVDYVCVYASRQGTKSYLIQIIAPVSVVRTVFIIYIHTDTIEIAGRCI